jgi:hypothetical protein
LELKNDLALAIGFALSFGLCYNVWANDLCNISELKNENTYGIFCGPNQMLGCSIRRKKWIMDSGKTHVMARNKSTKKNNCRLDGIHWPSRCVGLVRS